MPHTGYQKRFLVSEEVYKIAPCRESWWICSRDVFRERLALRLKEHKRRLPPKRDLFEGIFSRRTATVLFLIMTWSTAAYGQLGASFTASADHSTSLLTNYDLEIHPAGSSTITRSKNIGKPTPNASNTITHLDSAFFDGLNAGNYSLFVVSEGPGGRAASIPASFSISPPPTPPPAAATNVSIIPEIPPPSSSEVVLYGSDGAITGTRWTLIADATAAGGTTLFNQDGLAKATVASATPTSYVEMTFTAKAGTPYHIWFRLKANNNSYTNDSVFLQFSNARDAAGAAIARIGTTEALTIILEEGSGFGVSGWGWNDNKYGGTIAPHVYFGADGLQTLRVQYREDGLRLDQIVISPAIYLTSRPGLTKNDTTIVPQP